MATVEFDAGAHRQAITLTDGAAVLEYVEQPATGEANARVERALDAPLGLPPLRELAATLPAGRRRVVIAFDDPNRPLATIRTVLPAVLRHLNAAGVGDDDITLVSANGMHPKFSREAFAAYLGAAAIDRGRPRPVFYGEAMTDARGVIDVFVGSADGIRVSAWPEADRRFMRSSPTADVVIVGLAPAFLYGPAHNPLIALTGVCFPLRLWRGQPLLRPGGVVIRVTHSPRLVGAATPPRFDEAIARFGVGRAVPTVCPTAGRTR